MQQQTTIPTVVGFPFKIEYLKSWTIKRIDGTITKFVLSNAPLSQKKIESTGTELAKIETNTKYFKKPATGWAAYCAHTPGNDPLVTFTRPEEAPIAYLSLWVGNMSGAR